MEYTVLVTMADPAGNRTALVEGDVPQRAYGSVASQLLADPSLGAEQVGFVCPPKGSQALGVLRQRLPQFWPVSRPGQGPGRRGGTH